MTLGYWFIHSRFSISIQLVFLGSLYDTDNDLSKTIPKYRLSQICTTENFAVGIVVNCILQNVATLIIEFIMDNVVQSKFKEFLTFQSFNLELFL